MPNAPVALPPFSAVGLLATQFGTSWAYGTGAMISPTEIITCAHVLFNEETNTAATQVQFFPAWNTQWPATPPPPNGLAVAAAFYAAPFATGQDAWDVGYVRLAAAPAAPPPAFFTPRESDDQLVGQTIQIAGYSSVANGVMQTTVDQVNSVSVPDNLLTYTNDTWNGDSGGPIFWYDSESDMTWLRGVHTSQDTSDLRQGRLMTTAVLAWINNARYTASPLAFAGATPL